MTLKAQRLRNLTPARQRPQETGKGFKSLDSAGDVTPAESRKSLDTIKEGTPRSGNNKFQYFVCTKIHLKQATLTRCLPRLFQLLAAAHRAVRGANRRPSELRNGSRNKEPWQQKQRRQRDIGQSDVFHRAFHGGVDEPEKYIKGIMKEKRRTHAGTRGAGFLDQTLLMGSGVVVAVPGLGVL